MIASLGAALSSGEGVGSASGEVRANLEDGRGPSKQVWTGLAAVALVAAACGSGGNVNGQRSGAGHSPVTISWQLNGMATGSPLLKTFKQEVQGYERAHPWVHVAYVETNTGASSQQAYLVTEAGAGHVPDVTYDLFGQVDAGAVPRGILADLTKYLEAPNPYVPGNKHWIDLWRSFARPYMRTPSGRYVLLMGGKVATEVFYNKADFKKAGISAAPSTWASWVADMAKLKRHGITPFLFGDGGSASACNPSWFERKFSTEFLGPELASFNVNHSPTVLGGVDMMAGIERGIISMKNPAYAEGWKLLGQIRKYMAPGASSYNSCAQLTATTPPLSEVPPFIQNKAAMIWGTSGNIYQLNDSGFRGKYGFFPFPEITTATTTYSHNINVNGTVAGANGVGEIAVPTSKADKSMTPYKMHWVINLLQYLYSPQHEGAWVAGESQGTNAPLIRGAHAKGTPGVSRLLPKGKIPLTVDGILNASMGTKPALAGYRLVQAYVGGSLSYSRFAREWEGVLQSGVRAFARANHLNISKYAK